MLQRNQRRNNLPAARAGSIRRFAAGVAALSALAVGIAVSAPSASAVVRVGGQGWSAWGGDYAVSLPFVSGASYAAGSNPWNPQVITDFSTYNTVRFMDWASTNANENVAWVDRKLPTNTDQSAPWVAGEWVWAPPNNWSDTGTPPAKGQGMAYEWMVDLCNRTNTNMWICIPHKASDDYVNKLAQLILYGSNGTTPYASTQANPTWKPLNSNLSVYIEYSNEVWNFSFDQNHWAGQQATAQGLPDYMHYYGRRVKQVDSLFFTIWSGSTSRLVRVLGAQCVNNTWVEDNEIAQVTADGGTIDAVAVAPYWDVGDGSSSSYLTNAQTAITGQLANIDVHKTWANAHGVKLVCYEAGMACSVNADQARRNANNLSLYQTFLDGCNTHGVDLINLYAHCGAVSTGNSWGGKEFWAQATTAAPTWNGVVTWIANHPGSGNGGGGGTTIPPAPTGLTATAGNSQVALSWTGSSGATSYNVSRSTVSGSGYSSVATGISATSYTNTGLTNGTTYYFVVTATNTAGTSGNSSQASATPAAGGSTNLALNKTASTDSTQTGHAASAANDGNTTTRWTANDGAFPHWWLVDLGASDTLTSSSIMFEAASIWKYKIEVSPNSTTWTTAVDRTGNTTSAQTFADTFSTSGRYVRITVTGASSGYWASIFEAQIFGTTGTSAPPAPTGLIASPGNAQTALSWTASTGATSYNVLRSTVSDSGYASVATGIATTNYTNTGLTNGTTYYFVVTATNSGGTSGNSNQASATPTAGGGTNLVTNPGFESGSSPWYFSYSGTGNDPVLSAAAAHSGGNGVSIGGNYANISQTVTGLTPNTTYTLTAWGRLINSLAGNHVSLNVTGYGGSQVNAWVTTTTYTQYTVSFTTGASNTSAAVGFGFQDGSTCGVYCDDFNLH